MKDKTNLWRLYNAATAYKRRPSSYFRLETDIAKWALDEACLLTGRRFEAMLHEGKNPFASLAVTDGKNGYAPMATPTMKRMKIPESGIW